MAIFIQTKFSPSLYFPFWKEAALNISRQDDEKMSVEEMLDAFENELLKTTFQHFQKNRYHKMVESFNDFINTLTLVLLKIKDEEVLYQLAKEPSDDVDLNVVKNLSSNLSLQLSEEEEDLTTFKLMKELTDRKSEVEKALTGLEKVIKSKVDQALFRNYQAAKGNFTKSFEAYITKPDNEKEKNANKLFKESFNMNNV